MADLARQITYSNSGSNLQYISKRGWYGTAKKKKRDVTERDDGSFNRNTSSLCKLICKLGTVRTCSRLTTTQRTNFIRYSK